MVDVLIAEDTPLQQDLLQYFLEEYDISIKCANDGDEAVWLASVHNPALVIMDLSMPEKGGFQATKQIKSIDSTIKVIVSTAHPSERSMEKATEMGADDYLIKPYTKQELIDSINSVSGSRLE